MAEVYPDEQIPIMPYKVFITVYDQTSSLSMAYEIYHDVREWCKNNCAGYYYISLFGYIEFELKEDFALAMLTYG